jgi:ribosomal protein L37AE/L43A
MGDRECPTCLEDTLIEQSLRKWKCLKCEEVFDEKFLDDGCEESE